MEAPKNEIHPESSNRIKTFEDRIKEAEVVGAGIKSNITEEGVRLLDVKQIPDDPEILALLGKWADAWGRRRRASQEGELRTQDDPLLVEEASARRALKSVFAAKEYERLHFGDEGEFYFEKKEGELGCVTLVYQPSSGSEQ
jgi:hypothetical protein